MTKFNVDTDYFDHPKVKRLKAYVGNEADIFPIRLWAYAAKHFKETGILKDHTEPEIERILDYNGVPGNLVNGLVKVGFLDKKEGFYQVHDWSEHAGFLKSYSINGKRWARQRWGKHGDSIGHSNGDSIGDSNAIEKNRIEKNIKEHSKSFFDSFWKAYPKKVGKGAAEKAWAKVKNVPLEAILKALEAQKLGAAWLKDGGQFIPHPATWLNQRRWEDEVAVEKRDVFL